MLDKAINAGLKQVKETQNIDVEKMLEEMININPNLIKSAHINLQESKVFYIKALSHGDMGALSIYYGNTKLWRVIEQIGLFKAS